MVNLSSNYTPQEHDAMTTTTTTRRPRQLTRQPVIPVAPTPRLVAPGHYRIDSFSQTLLAYDLHKNEYGAYECNCPQYAFRHDCKHSKSLHYWLQEQVIVNLVREESEEIASSYARYTAETEPQPAVTLESLFSLPPSPQEVQEARRLERVGRRERVKEAW